MFIRFCSRCRREIIREITWRAWKGGEALHSYHPGCDPQKRRKQMRAALDNPEDARLRQAELEAARAGRERLMGTREREYGDVLPDLAVLSSEWSGESTRVPKSIIR